MGPRLHLSFCAFKAAWLASELLFSMGPCPHVWFLDAKQWLLDRNNKSLRVPDLTCRFVHAKQRDLHENDKSIWVPALICVVFMQNSDLGPDLQVCIGPTPHLWLCTHNSVFSTRIKRLYGFQPSPVVLCMQISDFSTWIASLYWYQPSSEVFACKTATFGPAHKSLWAPDLTSFCAYKTATLWPQLHVDYGSHTSPVIFCMQNSVPNIRVTSLYGFQPLSVVFACKTATFGPE